MPTEKTRPRAAPEEKEKKLLQKLLSLVTRRFAANLEVGSGNEHRILVDKDGRLIPGEKWRAAIPMISGIGGILAVLFLFSLFVNAIPAILCFGLLVLFLVAWQKCFLRVEEREVAVLFRKDHVYGYLRPGWYLVLRIFNLERIAYTVDRSRRETWDLEVSDVLTIENLMVKFDFVVTLEVRSLHEKAPNDVIGPDGKTPIVKKDKTLPSELQGPYLAFYRYKEGELREDIVTAVNAIAFVSCFGRTWDQIQKHLTKPEPKEKTGEKAEGSEAERDEAEKSFISKMKLSLEPLLEQAGFRLASVRVKNIQAPAELMVTATEQFKGEAEEKRMRGVVAAMKLLKEAGVENPERYLLTEKYITAFEKAGSNAGAVVVGPVTDALNKIEVDLRSGSPKAKGAETET